MQSVMEMQEGDSDDALSEDESTIATNKSAANPEAPTAAASAALTLEANATTTASLMALNADKSLINSTARMRLGGPKIVCVSVDAQRVQLGLGSRTNAQPRAQPQRLKQEKKKRVGDGRRGTERTFIRCISSCCRAPTGVCTPEPNDSLKFPPPGNSSIRSLHNRAE